MERFTTYFSAVVLATGNNNGINLKENSVYTFKSYYKLRCKGENLFKLFFINEVESTGNCRIGKKGDEFLIKEAYMSFTLDKEKEEGKTFITFKGEKEKRVSRGERYECDEFSFDCPSEGFAVLTFTVETKNRIFIPATNESASTGRIFRNGEELYSESYALRPAFFGVKKKFKKTVGFLGDSITQGSRLKNDSYECWTHRIGNSLPCDISLWNMGMGWARAYDGAANGAMIEKAAMCDEVFVCFGVNDLKSGGRSAEEIIEDLKKIKENIESRNKTCLVRFITVPAFNLCKYEEAERKKVNEFIRGTEEYFDIAKELEMDDEGTVFPNLITSCDDAHPNGEGGRVIFESFLKWQECNGWLKG